MRQNKDDSKQLKTTTIQYNYTKKVMANKEMGNGDGVTLEGRKKTREIIKRKKKKKKVEGES